MYFINYFVCLLYFSLVWKFFIFNTKMWINYWQKSLWIKFQAYKFVLFYHTVLLKILYKYILWIRCFQLMAHKSFMKNNLFVDFFLWNWLKFNTEHNLQIHLQLLYFLTLTLAELVVDIHLLVDAGNYSTILPTNHPFLNFILIILLI